MLRLGLFIEWQHLLVENLSIVIQGMQEQCLLNGVSNVISHILVKLRRNIYTNMILDKANQYVWMENESIR